MPTPATYFNEREHQICLVARMVEDARAYWVAGGGLPWPDDRATARWETPGVSAMANDCD